MSESSEKDGDSTPNDEFDFYIQFTKPLVLDLRSSEDKAIASAWVQKLEVPPQTEEEKKLRLDYLKLLLFVLQRGRLSGIFKKQPAPGGLQPFPQGFSMADMGNLIIDRDEVQSSGGGDTQSVPYTIELSSDLREFVAAQEIPNFGVQMYYAWSSDDAIHKWSLFDEDKFSSYVLDKIKQMKDMKSSDDKTSPKTCSKKTCDLSFTKNYTKSKVKSPEEIEKSQGRSYQTYVGLVGRMGGGFKDCDDDQQDKCPRPDPRKAGSSKKCGAAQRRCPVEMDEEYDNFLSGLSGGHNSTQKRNCKCPYPQHRPDCDAHGKGVQPFEERNPRSMSPIPKPDSGACNVWPAQGAGGNKRSNAPMDQCEYGTQFSPVASSQQRNMPACRSISPIRNDMSATGPAAFKDSNRMASCACPMPPCTCPCPRQPAQQNFQMDVPRATMGPSPSTVPQGSNGRSCENRNRMRLQRPVNLMAPPDPGVRSGGEAPGSSQAQLHCYNPQYQNACPKPQPTIKINQDNWYPDDECNKKPQGDDRRKQKIADLSKIIAKEAREEDELDEMFSACPYKRPQSSNPNRQNFECPQTSSSHVAALPQSPCKMRASPNQGKAKQQQPQGENDCFNFGAPPAQSAPPSSNQCYSGGFQQPVASNMTQGAYASPQCKRQPKSNGETYVKSAAYSPQNQVQYDERSCQYMQSSTESSEGRSTCPRPKSQSDNCQSGGFSSSNSYTGRANDLASVFQAIKLRTEAHREKCQSGGRRSQSGEPPACQRSSQSRSLSPFPNQPSYQCSQNKSQPQSQSQPQSSGKPCQEGMAEGQYADSSQNAPVVWAQPSTYCPQGNRQLMNYDTNDYRKEGATSPGKGMCSSGANQQPQSQSSGAYKSPKMSQGASSQACQRPQPSNCQRPPPSNYLRPPPSSYQGPPPSTCQGPPPSTCQGPPPSSCQGPPPSTCQGPPPSTCQGPPPSSCQGFQPQTSQGPSPSACQGFQPQTSQGPSPSACQGFQPQTSQGPSPSACQGFQPQTSQGPSPSPCQGFQPQTSQGPSPSPCQGFQPQTSQRPSPSACQGFQPQTSQGPSPSAYQGPPPSTCQGPPPSNFQELPSTGCQVQDEEPCDEEDEVSCPDSLDECGEGSSPSVECLDNVPCEDMQPQQWPAPAPSSRRSPEARPKDCSRRQFMVTSTPIQPLFGADESTISGPTPPPCNMDCQYEQVYGSYNDCQSQQPNQEAQFYPIFGNSDNPCVQGNGPSPQGFGGFMEMQNDPQATNSITTCRRRNMLAAPMPDDQQFTLSQSQSQFNSCNKPSYG